MKTKNGQAVHEMYLYLQAQQVSDEEKRLRELAFEYHERTEAYDRTVCTGPIKRGAIMPATHDEVALINQHALKVRKELGQKAESLGFTAKEWQTAITRCER